MSLHDDLVPVLIQDSRYTIEAYLFVLQSLDYARIQGIKKRTEQQHSRPDASAKTQERSERRLQVHVSGEELCYGAKELALRQYGLLAWPLLQSWGIHSTSHLGEIVYSLIESGDLEKTPEDSPRDFDGVFDFSEALCSDFEFTSGRGSDDPT
jgi:uncharacterized repeat protein (TIGR04138 family)